MSGGGKAPSTTTTISKSEPPAVVQPFMPMVLNRGLELSNRPYTPYGGTQVASLTPQHLQALSGTMARASAGSPLVQGAQQMGQKTLGNEFLNYGTSLAKATANPLLGLDNPYLNEAISRSQDDALSKYRTTVMPQLAAANRASGSFGNTGIAAQEQQARDSLARELGGISSGMRMQDYQLQAQLGQAQQAAVLGAYEAERGRQMSAMQQAPQLAETDYRDLQAMLGAGDVLREYQQQKLGEQYANWQAQQQWPYQQLDVLSNAMRAVLGAGGTTTQTGPNPYQSSRTASAIGGGALGYAGAQALGMGQPWLGGLLGAGAGYAMG